MENLVAIKQKNVEELRPYLHTKNFEYDIKKYPFKETIEKIFGCELSNIHKHLGEFKRFKRTNDQSTLAHKVFYSNLKKK